MTIVQKGTPSACKNALRVQKNQTQVQANNRMHMATQAAVGAFVLLNAHAAFAAQTTDNNLSEVVVTAARSEQVVSDALPSTTVITRADIEKAPVSDVVSLLKMQAGVSLTQNGTPGSLAQLRIRGGEARHTLVLLDGVSMAGLSSGTASLQELSLAMIERIEIVRGNVSALYGSQATGGVVQIFTRKVGSGQSATVRFAAGSHGQRQASAQVQAGSDKVQATVGISHDEVKAFSNQYPTSASSKVNPDKDGYKNDSANASIRYRPDDNNEFGLRFFESRGKNNYDNAYASSKTALQYNKTDAQSLNLYANNRITSNWKSAVRLSQFADSTNDFDLPASYGTGVSFYKTKTQEASWQNDIHTGVGDFIAGVSRTKQRLTSTTAYDNTVRTTTSLWAGYMLDKQRHHLQLNVRHDKLTGMAGENSASANYGFDIHPNWRVFAGYSNGFSAPTFNDLYYPGYSNPLLKPEHAIYTQAGVQFSNADFTGRLTGFETLYRDKIGYDANFLPINIARAKTQGVEWHGAYNRDGWTADVGLTYQEVKNRDTGALLLRQPRVLASIGLGKSWGKWLTQVNWQTQGKMSDVSGKTMTGYGVVNAAAFYNIRPDLKVGLTVGNVFNRDYKPLYGYNAMPRNALVSLQYQPKW